MTKTIIGLSGWARSGKDTVADYLVENHGFVKLSFAAPMRKSLEALNPYVGLDATRLAQVIHHFGWDGYKETPWGNEIRALLQRFGTEAGRNIFGESFWVDQAMKQAEPYDKVVFSDLRFKNEAIAVIEAGGVNWRITRTGVEAVNDHISEHDLDDFTFTKHVANTGNLDDLYKVVEENLNVS